MSPRFQQEHAETDDGWSRWVLPARSYKLACCDCGLVHDMETRVMRRTGETPEGLHILRDKPLDPDKYVAEFRVRINRRSTAQMRRHMEPRVRRVQPAHPGASITVEQAAEAVRKAAGE